MMPCLVWGCLIHPYDYYIILAVVVGIGVGYGIAYLRRD